MKKWWTGESQLKKSCSYAHTKDIIEYKEFMKIYDANKSTEIYLCWNFENFNLKNLDHAQWLADLKKTFFV